MRNSEAEKAPRLARTHYSPQPVTVMTWPVMPAAAGDARKTTASAISSRLVQRFRSFGFIAAMLDAVSTSPGATALTRIPEISPFKGQGASQSFNPRFGTVIGDHIGLRQSGTREVDDGTSASGLHVRKNLARD